MILLKKLSIIILILCSLICFTGCTKNNNEDGVGEAVKKFIKRVGKAYKKKIGYQADFYVVKLGNGPRILY